MPSKPPVKDLLDVVREFMQRDLLPVLSGETVRSSEFTHKDPDANLWFQCRVAINIVGIVRRELALRQPLEAAEQQRLIDLLGEAGLLDETGLSGEASLFDQAGSQPGCGSRPETGVLGETRFLDALNRKLCASIRNGEIGDDSPDLIRHLRATITGALRINNPKWIDQPE